MAPRRRSRLSHALDRALLALEQSDHDVERRATRGLDLHQCRTTQPAALDSLVDPLVQARSRGLRLTVDPTTLALAKQLDAVGRELTRMGPWDLVLWLRQRGDRLRPAMFDDAPPEEDDDG